MPGIDLTRTWECFVSAVSILFLFGFNGQTMAPTLSLAAQFPTQANGGISAGGGSGAILITGAGGEVCAITTGAVDSSGSIAYAQF